MHLSYLKTPHKRPQTSQNDLPNIITTHYTSFPCISSTYKNFEKIQNFRHPTHPPPANPSWPPPRTRHPKLRPTRNPPQKIYGTKPNMFFKTTRRALSIRAYHYAQKNLLKNRKNFSEILPEFLTKFTRRFRHLVGGTLTLLQKMPNFRKMSFFEILPIFTGGKEIVFNAEFCALSTKNSQMSP